MNKIHKTAIIGLLTLLVMAAAVVAYPAFRGQGMKGQGSQMGAMHEIMEEGTYQDLIDLRESTGAQIAPWIESEDDFAQMKQMHVKMQAYRDNAQINPQAGFRRGNGEGRSFAGCPMLQ